MRVPPIRAVIAAALLGCAPGVPDRSQALPPGDGPPAAAEPAPPPQSRPEPASGEESVREFDRLAARHPPRAEMDAFVRAHPELLAAGAAPYGPALLWALEFSRDDAALALLAAGAAVPDGALALAARGGMDGVVEELLRRGAVPDAGDAGGHTPLHAAARYGRTGTVGILLAAGARPDPRAAEDGFTPLHLAVIGRHVGTALALLAAGADPGARDGEGRTPLHWGPFAYAPQAKHVYRKLGEPHDTVFVDPGPAEVIGVLLDAGAAIEATDDRGNTPLHAAAAIGSKRGVEALLARGAEAGAVNASGDTPLAIAQRREDAEIARMLRAKPGRPIE